MQYTIRNTPFVDENGKYFPYLSLKEFIDLCEQDRLDEIKFLSQAWDAAKKGFKSAFGSWDKDEPETTAKTNQAPANVDAQPKDGNPDAITKQNQGLWDKIKAFAVKMKDVVEKASEMTGISAPLAMAILFAGYMGGFSAIPAAIILYFTRKILMTPILSFAGQAYDTAIDAARQEMGRNKAKRMATQDSAPQDFSSKQQIISGPASKPQWATASANEWVFKKDFQNYNLYKFAKANGFVEGTFNEWIANPDYNLLNDGKILDYLFGKAGSAAGHVAGFVTSSAKKVGKFLTKSIGSAMQWVWKWKVPIGKFLFLMAIGVLVGGTITKLTAPIINDAIGSVKSAISMGVKVPPQEVAALEKMAQNAGMDSAVSGKQAAASAGMPPEGWQNPDATDAAGAAQRAVDAKQALAQGKDIVDTLAAKYGNLKNRFLDIMRDMSNPDKDAVAVMNAAQSKADFNAAYEKAASMGSSYLRKFSDALEKISQQTGKEIPDIDVSMMAPDGSTIDQFGNIIAAKADVTSSQAQEFINTLAEKGKESVSSLYKKSIEILDRIQNPPQPQGSTVGALTQLGLKNKDALEGAGKGLADWAAETKKVISSAVEKIADKGVETTTEKINMLNGHMDTIINKHDALAKLEKLLNQSYKDQNFEVMNRIMQVLKDKYGLEDVPANFNGYWNMNIEIDKIKDGFANIAGLLQKAKERAETHLDQLQTGVRSLK